MSSSKRSLRILVTPLNAHGHINACHGLCEELRDRGHEVIFLLDSDFAGRLTKYGFKEHYISRPSMPGEAEGDGEEPKTEFWQEFVEKNSHLYSKSSVEQIQELIPIVFKIMFDAQNGLTEQYERAVEEIKPDLIIHDGYVCFPTIVNGKTPWVWLFSAAPHLLLQDDRIPPFFSGLPLKSAKNQWEEFNKAGSTKLNDVLKLVSDFNVSKGGSPLEGRLHPFSKHLNLYMWPEELRYSELSDIPSNIVGVDCFVRTVPDQKFDLPAQLQNRSGKLIFFSMGSFGCANRSMMTRLVEILAKSPHRFIVAKGPLQYDLPGENMWGDAFVPQTAILPMVDLVMTHGGNNTVTETFYYGKPMLVLPIFADQHDNAQRIAELGLGDKLNPFDCAETQLLSKIDRLVNDTQLAARMDAIGQRIRRSKDKQKVSDLIEAIFEDDSK